MAEFLTKVKCGNKTYNISHSGKDVYFSSSSSTGGSSLKGAKFQNNQIVSTSNGKPMTDFAICQAIEKSNSSGGCFISTSVCQTIGKSDDCYELNLLREFRDKVLLNNPKWSPMVTEYYRIAPEIVKRLESKPDSTKEKARIIYNEYLSTCIIFIENKQYKEAIRTYRKMISFCQLEL